SFLTGTVGHYIPLNARQELSWRVVLEGPDKALASGPGAASAKWVAQVKSGAISSSPDGGLQLLYTQGLDAFDSYSQSTFMKPFAQATPLEQDLMIETAGNVVVGQLPVAPAPAKALFPSLVLNVFQGTYGLPEYKGQTSTPIWADIGWDGDTQPLGSSIYDHNLTRPPPGQVSNAGFGEAGVYVPVGYYKEHRPVSTLAADNGLPTPDLGGLNLLALVEYLISQGLSLIGIRP
ncbi:MAG: gluconate 2-dehydrogenase subunit 3 family protein, partial [Acidimicrobiia bacterium]|nr:gluconate 2-dehydrogenase subunit 3 family protein [Acidimicrobiia bacterium]